MRKACRILMVDTSSYQYTSRRPGQYVLTNRIKATCQTRVRYGHRPVQVRRQAWPINQKKTRRIFCELGLQLRNKTPKRRVKPKPRDDRKSATGHMLEVLTVFDTYSHLSASDRFAVQLPWGRCCTDRRQGVSRGQLSENDLGRPGQRVRLARPRFVGLCPGRDAGLLPAG